MKKRVGIRTLLMALTIIAISAFTTKAKASERNFIMQPPGSKVSYQNSTNPVSQQNLKAGLPGWASTLFSGIIYAATAAGACTIASVAYQADKVFQVVGGAGYGY